MAKPLFLDIDHAMRLHRSLIEHYGGVEGTRDTNLLHSAMSQPQAAFGGNYLMRFRLKWLQRTCTTSCRTIRSSMATNAPARHLLSCSLR